MMRPGSAVPAQPGESDLLREAPTSLVSKVEGSATPASGPAWKRPVIIGAVVAVGVLVGGSGGVAPDPRARSAPGSDSNDVGGPACCDGPTGYRQSSTDR